ncbi:uncharacterized protein LOC121262033 [Juglans microcarpa x Juglans regia]|uniref:uncharacterized protein LOC121262033 n=1 Tax=Juglans microcarpa x Juglans regia TaxID=2249226 RepID=UPI001B7F4508|nr:uncharacterized protein LOC121262033 [Juglans microcarpa x Juglans regia]
MEKYMGAEGPKNVKLLMWKVGNELLAFKRNLFQKKIIENPYYPICKKEEETTMHVLWQCPIASDVWSEFHSVVQKWNKNEDDLLSLWERLMERVSKVEMEEIATVMRSLWLRRNEFIFEGKFKSPSQVVRTAREGLNEFRMAQQNVKERQDRSEERRNQK